MASSHVSQRVRRSAGSPPPTRPQPLRATVPFQLRAGAASPPGQGVPAVGKAAAASTSTTSGSSSAVVTPPSSSSPPGAAVASATIPAQAPCAPAMVPGASLPCAPAAQNYGKRSAALASVVTTSTGTSTSSSTSSGSGGGGGGGGDNRAVELSPLSAVGLEERGIRLCVPSTDYQAHHHHHQQQQYHHHHQQGLSPERRSPSSPVTKVQRSRTFHVAASAGAGWQGETPGALTGPYLSGQWPRDPPAGHGLGSTCDKATQTPCTWTDRAPERRSSLHRRSASWGSADPRREIVKLRQQLQRGKSRGAGEAGVAPGVAGGGGGGSRDAAETADKAAPPGEHQASRRDNIGSPAAALGHAHASWPRRDSIPVSSVPLGRWGLAWLRGSLEGLNQELEGVFLHHEDADRARRQLQNAPDGHRAPLPCPPGRGSATRTVDTQTPPAPARRDARTPSSPDRAGPQDRASAVAGGGATRPADGTAAPAASPSHQTDGGGGGGKAEAAAKRRGVAAVTAGHADGPDSPCLAPPPPPPQQQQQHPDGRSPFVCVCVEAEAVPAGGPGAGDGPHAAVGAGGGAAAVAAVALATSDGAFFLPKLISAPRAGRSSTFPKPVRAARGPEDRPAPEGREGSPVGSCNLEELSAQFGGTVTISSPDKNKVNFIPNSNSAFISIRSIKCPSLSCLEGASDADWARPPACRTLVMDRDTSLTKPHVNRGQAPGSPGVAGGRSDSRDGSEQSARAACPAANRTGTPERGEPAAGAGRCESPSADEQSAAAAVAARPPGTTTSPKPSSQGASVMAGLLGAPQSDGERGRAGATVPSQTYPVLC